MPNNNSIIVLDSFNIGIGVVFRFKNIVINSIMAVANSIVPMIFDIVVTNMSGFVNSMPPIMNSIIELTSELVFL